MSNDIWSLGIILLNLATGRNPWKTATPDDPTFQAYLRDPLGFFPSVLPVSSEVNDVLVRLLHIDSRERITLSELREALEDIQNFYSEDVVFEGSMARCSWEEGLDIGSDPAMDEAYDDGLDWQGGGLKSAWSEDSESPPSTYPWTPDVPGASFPAHYTTDATKPRNSSLFQDTFSSSYPISCSEQTYWTSFQSSKDFRMEEVLDTLPQHEMFSESSILRESLDEGSAPITSLTSICSPLDEDQDKQTGAAHSPTWLPSKKHMSLSSDLRRSPRAARNKCVLSPSRDPLQHRLTLPPGRTTPNQNLR
jgi:serine/threonine protein kinase